MPWLSKLRFKNSKWITSGICFCHKFSLWTSSNSLNNSCFNCCCWFEVWTCHKEAEPFTRINEPLCWRCKRKLWAMYVRLVGWLLMRLGFWVLNLFANWVSACNWAWYLQLKQFWCQIPTQYRHLKWQIILIQGDFTSGFITYPCLCQ